MLGLGHDVALGEIRGSCRSPLERFREGPRIGALRPVRDAEPPDGRAHLAAAAGPADVRMADGGPVSRHQPPAPCVPSGPCASPSSAPSVARPRGPAAATTSGTCSAGPAAVTGARDTASPTTCSTAWAFVEPRSLSRPSSTLAGSRARHGRAQEPGVGSGT